MSSKVTTGGKMGNATTAAASRKKSMAKMAAHIKRMDYAAHVAATPF